MGLFRLAAEFALLVAETPRLLRQIARCTSLAQQPNHRRPIVGSKADMSFMIDALPELFPRFAARLIDIIFGNSLPQQVHLPLR